MLEQILNRGNLLQAWKRVRANGGAPGVDGLAIKDFPDWLQAHWPEVKASLLDGTYRPAPVRRHEIPKRSGGKRPLGIPTVLDRVIQQAILQVVQPIFDHEAVAQDTNPDSKSAQFGRIEIASDTCGHEQ